MPISDVVYTAPESYPVATETLEAHLRLPSGQETELLELYLGAATEQIERITGRQLITATRKMTLDFFPLGTDWIRFLRGPVQSVDSVVYLDAAGDAQTLDESAYVVDDVATDQPGRLMLAPNATWPDVSDRLNAITVTYDAGHGDAPENVPAPLRAAVLFLAAHWFERRLPVSETPGAEVPCGLRWILDAFSYPRLG